MSWGAARRLRALAVVLLLVAIYFVYSVGAEVYLDEFVQPRSLYASLLLGTVITTVAALPVSIDLPR